MKREFYFHDKYDELTHDLMITIPSYDTIKTYYKEFDEKIKKPDLYGKTVKVSSKQFPNVHRILTTLSQEIGMEAPEVFVYENFYYEIESYGTDKPWIEVSAKTIADFNDEELKFLFAREFFKIKNGITELYMVSEQCLRIVNENLSIVVISDSLAKIFKVKYAQWSRVCQFSADNFAFLHTRISAKGNSCCIGDLRTCLAVMLTMILNNRKLVEVVDLPEYLNSAVDINRLDDSVSTFTKNDERMPYGQFRIKNLIRFASLTETLNYFEKRGSFK